MAITTTNSQASSSRFQMPLAAQNQAAGFRVADGVCQEILQDAVEQVAVAVNVVVAGANPELQVAIGGQRLEPAAELFEQFGRVNHFRFGFVHSRIQL